MPCHFGSTLIQVKNLLTSALLLSFLIAMAGTGKTGEFFDWSVLDGAETVTSFTLEPSEAETRDEDILLVEEAVIETAGRVDDALADDTESLTSADVFH